MSFLNIIDDTAANWTANNPVLDNNAIGREFQLSNFVQVDTLKYKLGNGVDHWNDLPYGPFPPGIRPDIIVVVPTNDNVDILAEHAGKIVSVEADISGATTVTVEPSTVIGTYPNDFQCWVLNSSVTNNLTIADGPGLGGVRGVGTLPPATKVELTGFGAGGLITTLVTPHL